MGFRFNIVAIAAGCWLLAVGCWGARVAWAGEDPAWLADKARLQEIRESHSLSNEEECQATWDILWPWAKKGNLGARASLFFFVFPPGPHADVLFMPGRSGDFISQTRDAVILAVHSTGVELENEEYTKRHYGFANALYSEVNIGYDKREFLECVTAAPRSECVDIAVRNKIVPPFEDYVAEIEALIKQGMKPKCFFN